MKEREEVIKFYDSFTNKQGLNKRHYGIFDNLVRLGLKEKHSILEIGCGIGSLTQLLAIYLKKGKITSFDISPESINIAKKNLARFENINLFAQDVALYDFGTETYDVIVMPDVLEHIPINIHYELFQKLSKVLKPSGFIFINIPNPEYLGWCIKNTPNLLQIIDQPILTDEIVRNTYPHGFFIDELKTYSLWVRDCDYQYIVLKKRGYQNFTIPVVEKVKVLDKIKYKFRRKK